MSKNAIFLILGSGWILLGMFLLSGNYYNQLANDTEGFSFAPVRWGDHLQIFKGAIQCKLTSDELMERKLFLKEKVFSRISKKDEVENGFIYYFDDDPILLNHVFEFVEKEKACCPFFKFDISILPFEHGFALQISGSEAAFNFLKDMESSIS